MPEQIFDDCCEFYQLVGDAKAEVDPCTEMTRRCKGDTCATCPSCLRFIRARLHRSQEASVYAEEADDNAKSETVISIPIASGTQVGIFRSRYVELQLDWLDSEDIYEPGEEFTFNLGAVLEKYRSDRKWRDASKAYCMATVEQRTQEQIAEKVGVDRSVISHRIDAMRGETSRVAGADYEAWKVQQLTRRGFDVQHLGGNGEPDIIATHSETKEVRIISCMCMDVDRKIKLPIAQISPELHEARRRGCPLVLSVHNLCDHTGQELAVDREHPPKLIDITPVGAG